MNSMKMTIKVGTKFSSKSPQNTTPYTVERGGYLYPWASVRYSQIAPLQLMYNSFTDGFWVNLQGERCTNLTFSHIHVLHARLLPTKVLKTFVRVAFYTQYRSGLEGLRRFWSSGTCSQAINRHLRPPEGDPLDASQVVVLRLVLLRDQSSPSASRRWSPRCFAGCGPQACAPEWSAFTFGPEGGLPGPRCLGWHWSPFGRSCYPTPEPYRQIRRCFRGWD